MKRMDILKTLVIAIWGMLLYACSENNDSPTTNQPVTPEEDKATITCTTENVVFDSGNGSHVLNFTTDKEWNIAILGNVSWCTLSSTSGKEGTANVTISVTENTAFSDRNVTLAIKCGNATHNVVVTQKQQNALLVSTAKYEVPQEGGTIEVSVKTNTDYQWEIASGAQSWIKESASRVLTGYSHTFIIAANESSTKREGKIYFKSDTQTDTVTVYQDGANYVLMLTQNEYKVSDTGGTITVEIKSNVEYGVQMPGVDWIKAEESSRALSSHTMRYIVEPNISYESRTAEIVFYDKENRNLRETLRIVQDQKDVITVSKNSYDVDAEETTIEVEVLSNVEYELNIASSWIKQVESGRVAGTEKLHFRIEENSGEERKGQITLTNKEKGLTQEIVVRQQAKAQQPPKEDKDPEGNVGDMNWGK